MQIKAVVSLKNGVLDPQAKAIHHALNAHGFESLKGVRLAREIVLDLDITDEAQALKIAKEMCEELLANLVIEEYQIERV
ncbi:phosphoribosylformylglycinamidine synthase, purS protein [Helicobacter sp. MIT 00-7814]|uniref:phosphoribosylformylglycinamidine synthase subunit PurS n=1 Tax=unclassified Helicobacter TaxID=2593540 RepID=UPI000E1EE9E3|nr:MULTISPECIES: phosphoribosylformylglycinamidine synthase subunit PurS [unclassified Helicobacter]RDU53301.1 phosphoribosylformylglycinamidine synthase, purS protein [Helicobacter sp. MIT 99-10781]RDU56946.1 phosphoribosylformylglycinamidine synthase, purS protein [Helicobacter sp. MIT 00-7814]